MKKRILSSIVLALIFIPVFLVDGLLFNLFCGVIGILAYKEIISLEKFKKLPNIIKGIGLFVLILLIYINHGYSIYLGIPYQSLIILFMTLLIPTLFIRKYSSDLALSLGSYITLIGLFLNSTIMINDGSKWILLYIILISCITDIFAFLVGIIFGKHKFSSISPNKTIEGSLGGALMATVIGTIYYLKVFPNSNLFLIIFVSLFLSAMCEVGDLVFSRIKRDNNIKDFSNLIPGHGGLLDRIDSLIFAMFTYVILLILI